MKVSQLPIKSIEEKHLVPHLLRKIQGAGGGTTLFLDDNQTLYKEVHVVTAVTENNEDINLFPSVVSGVTLTDGDLVALVVQTDLSENGVYIYQTGSVFRIYDDFVVDIFIDANTSNVWYLTLAGRQIGDNLIYDYLKNTDVKVAVSSSDSGGYLINKLESSDSSISIVDNGATVDLTTSGGGLPAGAVNQTLRHDGTDWVANDILLISDSVTKSVGLVGLRSNNAVFNVENQNANGIGTDTFLITNPDTYYANRIALRNFISNGNGYLQYLGYSTTIPDVSTSAYHFLLYTKQSGVDTEVCKISHNGTISSKPLANASNYLLKANASGEIVLSTDTEGGGGASLPPGTTDQTLRHDGTDWVASSLLTNSDDTVNVNGNFGNHVLIVDNIHVNGSAGAFSNDSNFETVRLKNAGTGKLIKGLQDLDVEVFGVDNNGNITSKPLENASNQLVYADVNGTLKLSSFDPTSVHIETTTVTTFQTQILPGVADIPANWKTFETLLVGAGTYKVNIRIFLNTDSSNIAEDYFKANFRLIESVSTNVTSILAHRIAGGASEEPADIGNIFDLSIPHQHIGMTVYPKITILQQPKATMLDLTAIIISTDTATVNLDFKANVGDPYDLFSLEGGYKEIKKI